MSIPKIAISNEDDSSLRILENHLKTTIKSIPSNFSSPRKSIIKARSSQPQSPSSSSTTQSFHTCVESTRKESLPLKRSYTISVVKNPSEQQSENRIRRINSYQSSIRKPLRFSIETPCLYQTPKHEENSIRLIIDTDSNIINDQCDMQVEINQNDDQPQTGVRMKLIEDFREFFFLDFSSLSNSIIWRTNI